MTNAISATAHLTAFDNVLVAHLLAEALSMLENDQPSARRHIERAYSLAHGEVVLTPARTGRLAEWQLRRIEAFVQEHLGTALRIADAAACIKLSTSYFSRAFKASKGMSYSEYITLQRVTRAKRLLLTTELAIVDIALVCGFSDQPHLTRIFRQLVGLPPFAWRRQQAAPLAQAS